MSEKTEVRGLLIALTSLGALVQAHAALSLTKVNAVSKGFVGLLASRTTVMKAFNGASILLKTSHQGVCKKVKAHKSGRVVTLFGAFIMAACGIHCQN